MSLGWNLAGATVVVVAIIVSLLGYCLRGSRESAESRERRRKKEEERRTEETHVLAAFRKSSQVASLAFFPISCFEPADEPSGSQAVKDRDNRVDIYIYGWAVVLIASVIGLGLFEFIARRTADAATLLAWICAYRVVDIAVSRTAILTNFAGEGPFSLPRARRSLLGSVVVLGQVIIAFAIMFDGWTGAATAAWPTRHLVLGFAYISLRVLFTLGPPEDPLWWVAKILVGAEVLTGFSVIALGIADYVSALRNARATS